jgi:hypothetical protein
MNNKELFQAAFALIKNPATWTKDYYAKSIEQTFVTPESEEAVCWCSQGALIKVLSKDNMVMEDNTVYNQLTKAAKKHLPKLYGCNYLAMFNDGNTHEAVVALWEEVGKENNWL